MSNYFIALVRFPELVFERGIMKVKGWLILIGVCILVGLPAPVILAGALSTLPALAEYSVAELLSFSVTSGKLVAALVVVLTTALLVGLGYFIAAPLVDRAQEDDREEGLVKWFNVSKGFGFVTRDNGEDVFVHFRSIRGRGHRSLQEGQRVKFGVVESAKGLQAEDVTIVRQR